MKRMVMECEGVTAVDKLEGDASVGKLQAAAQIMQSAVGEEEVARLR